MRHLLEVDDLFANKLRSVLAAGALHGGAG